jgi:16S rRNA (adenine1518-N6/adenine1519-N6)-dimethyltransferase
MIGELKNQPKVTIIMIQEEVAERICAQPPKMNRLAASIQYWAKPKIIARAPKTDFSPPPEVDSAVIKLETLEETGRTSNYYEVMRAIFAQPRKTILNNLGDANLGSSVGDTKETKANIILKLQKLGIDPGSRPQNLTIENIRAIAEACG